MYIYQMLFGLKWDINELTFTIIAEHRNKFEDHLSEEKWWSQRLNTSMDVPSCQSFSIHQLKELL